MAIYRGDGGAGDATSDITINRITELSSETQDAAAAAASSATSASSSASAASTSATNAANSASAASTSETNAATSETNAATSETNAAASETNAAASAASAASSDYAVSSWFSTTNNSSNWDTAYGWGNHAIAGYVVADGAVVINESGANVDFRIESDTDVNAFFLEGSNGNVGIGTSTPSYKAEIYSGSLGTSLNDRLDTLRLTTDTSNTDTLNFSKIRTSAGTDWTTAAWRLQQRIDATNMGYIEFNGDSNNFGIRFGRGDSTEHMRITSTGNVGIGTSSPTQALTVVGDIDMDEAGGDSYLRQNSEIVVGRSDASNFLRLGSSNATDYLRLFAGGTERMRITPTGNVGIGTGSSLPVDFGDTWTSLEVRGKSTTTGGVFRLTTSDASVRGDAYVDNSGYVLRTATNHPFVVATNATERMRITSTGNVGIGTASPSTKLDVNGTVTATGGNSTDWNTAYGWGDHASAGYALTSDIGTTIQAYDATLETGATKTSRKNAIINGNFAVNQRGVSGTVTLAAGVYGHDRWKAGASGCTYTFATSANVTTLTITAGSLIQVIEGANLFSGTYSLSWSGTAQGKIGAGSYSASGVTGSVTGGTNLNIEFNTGTLSKVQFETGSVVTDFEQRPIGEELALCQRYYYRRTGETNVRTGLNGNYFNSTSAFHAGSHPVVMRASPTSSSSGAGGFTVYSAPSSRTGTSISISANEHSFEFDITTTASTAGQGAFTRFTNLSDYYDFDAEL